VIDDANVAAGHNSKEIAMPKSQKQSPAAPVANSNRPVHTIRHRRLKAVIWRNDTEKGPMFNVMIVRSYQDGEGKWHDTQSFGYDDLMNVAALMHEAHAFISTALAEVAKTRATARI
jgi:hypothetical protein